MKAALTLMEFWLDPIHLVDPDYNSGISSDNVSICLWVSEKASKSLQVVGLHESVLLLAWLSLVSVLLVSFFQP